MEFCSGTGDSLDKWPKKWIAVGRKAAHAALPWVGGFRLALSAHPQLHRHKEKCLRVCVKEQDRTFFKKKNVTKDTYGMRSDTALSLVNYSLASLWHFKPLAVSEYSFVVPLLLT